MRRKRNPTIKDSVQSKGKANTQLANNVKHKNKERVQYSIYSMDLYNNDNNTRKCLKIGFQSVFHSIDS